MNNPIEKTFQELAKDTNQLIQKYLTNNIPLSIEDIQDVILDSLKANNPQLNTTFIEIDFNPIKKLYVILMDSLNLIKNFGDKEPTIIEMKTIINEFIDKIQQNQDYLKKSGFSLNQEKKKCSKCGIAYFTKTSTYKKQTINEYICPNPCCNYSPEPVYK